jgi:hypothetical protein
MSVRAAVFLNQINQFEETVIIGKPLNFRNIQHIRAFVHDPHFEDLLPDFHGYGYFSFVLAHNEPPSCIL